MAHVEFSNTGNKFSFRKVTTTVHNIIVGKLWVDQHGTFDCHNPFTGNQSMFLGDMEIIGKKKAEGIKCHLKYVPYSYFNRDSQRRVKGAVTDASGSVKWIINGEFNNYSQSPEIIVTTV